MERIEPAWVCFDCAYTLGATPPDGHCYTTHTDLCGICEEQKTVTEPRDFGLTRTLISNDLHYILNRAFKWRRRVTSQALEYWLDKAKLYSKYAWLVLIEEKLRRSEVELYIE